MYGDQNFTEYFLVPEHQPNNPGFPKISDSLREQWNSSTNRKFLVFKIISVMIGIALLVINACLNLSIRTTDCILDSFQDWTASINTYLVSHKLPRDILIAFASFLIDFNVLIVCLRWVLFGKSLRLFLVIIVFYLFRGICQRIFYMKFPEGYIFSYPGFPSLVVPYAPANDFFFSGHLGISTICFLEFRKDQSKFLKIIGLITIPVEFFMLLVTRKHHFIDMAVGLIVAHYVFIFGLWLDETVRTSRCQSVRLFGSVWSFKVPEQPNITPLENQSSL